ncbi:protein lifeguard 2-like isoform X2 [Apostichopus japonicus]|uniref:protein lifeguard 2-like isoform X2 n=1 Tax=Stichopus japonicus TaxID=307972 RepID=UPI003AB6203A
MDSSNPPPYNETDPAYPPGYQHSPYPPPQGNTAYPPPQTGYAYPPQDTSANEPLLAVNNEGGDGGNVGFTSTPSAPPHSAETGGFSATPGSFDDKAVRHGFIRKVYLILSCQLAVTFGITCFFFFSDPVKEFIHSNQWLYWIAYAIFLVTYITLVCCGNVRRNYPTNLIALCIFTLAMSYMVGTITSFYSYQSDGLQTVLVSLGICVGVVFSVSIFAIQTRFDFTGCGGFLFVFLMGLSMFGIIAIVFASTGNSVLYTVYAWLAAVLFTMFLVYDTQLIIGGRRHEISAEEYIYGALQLYVDIVYIFLIILNLVGRS